MKILVNGYNLRQTSTGIANLVINTLNSFVENNISVEVVVSPVISEEIKSRLSDKIELKIIGSVRSFKWLMSDFPKYAKKVSSDIIWSPTPLLPNSIFKLKKPVLVTVNDFVSIEYRKTMTFKGRLITRLLEKRTIKEADFLWCISNYTKSKLEHYYPIRKCKEIFVGCAPDKNIKRLEIQSSEDKRSFFSRFKINKNYLLFVGSLEPRKNLSFLLKLFEVFHKKHDMQLVIVGARNWGNTNLVEIINEKTFPKADVIFTPFISEKDLMILYSYASCYVSTSLNEGFGLPQAESMICECPVVTAHNSAMIEVVAGYGITVEGWNISEWVNAIEIALDKSKEIVEKQNIKAKSFNWTKIIYNLCEYLK